MRNSKVKKLRKTVLFTLSLMLVSAGASLADTAWDTFKTNVTSNSTATLSGTANADSTLQIGTDAVGSNPPVPHTVSVTGSGSATINATGYTADAVIKNTNGSSLTLTDISIKNADNQSGDDLTAGGGAIRSTEGSLDIKGTITKTAAGKITNDSTSTSTYSGNKAVNGGAIKALQNSTIKVNGAVFDQNEATKVGSGSSMGYGGAIFINSTATGTTLDVKDSFFKNNKAHIYDVSTGLPSGGLGGAIANYNGSGKIDNTIFTENFAHTSGGAIYNRADLTVTDSVFEKNYTKGSGGAITNGVNSDDRNAILTVSNSSFENNHTGTSGGAIFNQSSANGFTHTLIIENGTSFVNNFTSNDAKVLGGTSGGGAIYNKGGSTTDNTTDALLYVNFKPNASFDPNAVELDLTQGTLDNSSSSTIKFQNNLADKGGAIANRGIAVVNNAEFTSNGVMDSTNTYITGFLNNGQKTSLGGAVYNGPDTGNAAKMIITNSTFNGNQAKSNGGAIYNSGDLTVIDSDFANNKAAYSHSAGGAIYTEAKSAVTSGAVTKIIAQNKDVNIGVKQVLDVNGNVLVNGSFADNTDSLAFKGDNDYKVTGKLLAANGRTININSSITGTGSHTTETIGPSSTTKKSLVDIVIGDDSGNYNGNVNFNDEAYIQGSNIHIKSGTVSFAHDRNLEGTNSIYMSGGTLNLYNNEYWNQIRPREFHVTEDSHVIVDVNLTNQRMDGIFKENDPTHPNYGGVFEIADGKHLIIDKMYAKGDTPGADAKIQFTNAPELQAGIVDSTPVGGVIQGSIYKYEVSQYDVTGEADPDKNGVYFGFNKIGYSDPVISAPVAAQIAAYVVMDNLYRQSFANMDMVALLTPEQREMLKALQGGGNRLDDKRARGYRTGVFAPNTVPEERDGLYVRPFANFENIHLKNGPKVSNVFYGSLIGGESDLIELGHGWDGTFSLFGAYQGSHQAYSGVDVWQNGGTLGAVGTVYKGRFFSGLTANVGASASEIRHGFGNDQFPILMTGAAWKSGYNLGMFNNRLILQPSYMMSYTFVNVFDYTSASGARITHDPLNALEIIPGVRLIGNFKNGWQPYIGANFTWNILDKTKFYADDVMLPQLSIKPFVEYGLGMQKRYGDRFTGFGQAMFRNGGRNGVAFTLGLRWALGN